MAAKRRDTRRARPRPGVAGWAARILLVVAVVAALLGVGAFLGGFVVFYARATGVAVVALVLAFLLARRRRRGAR